MAILCRKCKLENENGRLYCQRCSSRLRHATSHDLTADDFVTDGDRQAFEALKTLGPLLHLVYWTFVEPRLRGFAAKLSKKSRVNQEVVTLAAECAEVLALDVLPVICVVNIGQPNAFTTGTDSSATITIDASLVEHLSHSQLRALLGHEMGHIKSRHLMYHSVTEFLEHGIALSASMIGAGLISVPMRLLLLAWHRESEFSADRTSLIAAGDFSSVTTMFAQIVSKPLRQAGANTPLGSFVEAFQSHPSYLKRLTSLEEFKNSARYSEIRTRLERRKTLEAAFAETCRFCGAPKGVEEIFCPVCKLSLA